MRNILVIIVLFFCFYLEHFFVLGIQFSILWKIPFLFILIINVFQRKIVSNVVLLGYFLAFKNVVTINLFSSFLEQFIQFSKFLVLPLFVHFLLINNKISVWQIRKYLTYLTYFIVLSNIPFFLGVLSPVKQTSMGDFSVDMNSFTGVFGSPHATSVYLSLAIVILYSIVKFSGERLTIFNFLILSSGLVMLFKTYVRTGWFMFLIGIFVLYVNRINISNIKKAILCLSCGLIFLTILFVYNQPFRERLLDNRQNTEDADIYEKIGSGRLQIWKTYFHIWREANLFGKLIGISNKEAMIQYQQNAGGNKLFAHNAFVKMFVTNGVIGFIIMLLYLQSIFSLLNKHLFKEERKMFVAIFFMWMVCMLVQQANYFMLNIILAMIISIAIHTNILIKVGRKYEI